jgi:hypothetical protein
MSTTGEVLRGPIPTAAAEVPGPSVRQRYDRPVGDGRCEAYIWGRPLVNTAKRVAAVTGVPEPSVLGVVSISVASKLRAVASRVSASSVATEL